MRKVGSILIIALISTFFACNSGNKEYKNADSTNMSSPDTSMNRSNNMNNMPADTMKRDTGMKK